MATRTNLNELSCERTEEQGHITPPIRCEQQIVSSELGVAAAMEAQRIAEKYGKDFLDCEELVKIIGVGRNNIRQLMNSDDFPTVEIGNRKVVSVIAFTLWSLRQRG